MNAARILYASGGCFLLAAALQYFHKDTPAFVSYAAALALMVWGIIALGYSYWKEMQSKPQGHRTGEGKK